MGLSIAPTVELDSFVGARFGAQQGTLKIGLEIDSCGNQGLLQMSTFHVPPELDLLFGSGPTRLAIEYNPSCKEPTMVGQVKGVGPSCQDSYQNNAPDLTTTKLKGRKRHKSVKNLQEKKCIHGSSDSVSFSADILYNF